MEPFTIAMIAGALMGAQKSSEQQHAYKMMTKTEATRERWAPFTGRRGQTLEKPSQTDPIMQAMLAGAMMGQQFKGSPSPTGEAVGGPGVGGVGAAGTPLATAQPYTGAGTGGAGMFNPYGQVGGRPDYIPPGG